MATATTVDRSTTQSAPTIRYLPPLDGLRAVAVVGVMLYHGGISWLPGGFLGVDLFFVLSGFLITSLLLAERARWGSVDLFAFWARRARRLLPALFLMLLAVAVYAATLAPKSQQADIRGEGLATLAYVSNWWAILNGHSYFDQFLQPSPLTHTWSLAIEEQWYLVFPIVLTLVLAARVFGRRLGVLLAAGAVASAVWMAVLFQPGTDPSRVYFATGTRAQDLLVGAALAAWASVPEARRRVGYRPPGWYTVLPIVAFVLVLVAMAVVHEESPALYRGGFLVFSVLTAVVIASCLRPGGGPLGQALSWEPVRLVGVVSYGLYLWHWPVDVVLTPVRTGLEGPALLALRLGVTVVVSVASYLLLERPIRNGLLERSLGGRTTAWLALGSGLAVAAALVIATPTASAAFGADGEGSGTVATGQGKSVFFVGDSVSYNLRYYFDPATSPGVQLNGSAHLGCGLIPKTNLVNGEPDPPGEGCPEWAAQWPADVRAAHPDLGVLFLGSWEQFDMLEGKTTIPFGTPEYQTYLDHYMDGALATLAASSGQVAVVNVPCHRVVEDGVNMIPTIVNDQGRIDWLNAYLASYQARSAVPFTLLDLNRFVCVDGDPVERDGIQLRTDGLHFTPEGAAMVWTWLAPELLRAAGDGAPTSPSPSPAASTPAAAEDQPTMFFVGDSVAYNLRYYLDPTAVPGWTVLGSTRLGCGVFPQTIVVGGELSPPAKGCRHWAAGWPEELADAEPELGVLFLGIGEQYTVDVEGTTIRFGTPAYRAYLDDQLGAALEDLSAVAPRVAVVNVPCHTVAEDGTNLIPSIVNDERRITWLNTYLKDLQQRSPVAFTLLDLNRFLCLDGDPVQRGEVQMRSDGLHFTQEGAALVWAWLGPMLRQAAG